MLAITRKVEQSVTIGDDIEVKILKLGSRQVTLGIKAPMDQQILRDDATIPTPRAARTKTVAEENQSLRDRLAALEFSLRTVREVRDELQEQNSDLREQVKTARQDCLTLALRVMGEKDNTHSPTTLAVMDRWRPICHRVLEGAAKGEEVQP